MNYSQIYTDIVFDENNKLNVKLPIKFDLNNKWYLQIHSIWIKSQAFFRDEFVISISCNIIQSLTRNSVNELQTQDTPLQIISYRADSQKFKFYHFENNTKFFINNPSNNIIFNLNPLNFPLPGTVYCGIHYSIKRFE